MAAPALSAAAMENPAAVWLPAAAAAWFWAHVHLRGALADSESISLIAGISAHQLTVLKNCDKT